MSSTTRWCQTQNFVVVCFVRFMVVYLKNSLFLYAEVNKIEL